MASQRPVSQSTGPTFIGSDTPPANERFVGASWLDTSSIPHLLKTWDGSTWVVQDYLSSEGQLGVAGYIFGHFTISTSIEKLDFNAESFAQLASGLLTAMYGAGTVQDLTAARTLGGWVGGGNATTVVQKFDFSAEFVTSVTSSLSSNRYAMYSASSSTAGYCMGGSSGSTDTNTIQKLVFSSDNTSTLSSTLSVSKRSSSANGIQSSLAGYAPAGISGGSSYYTTVDKLLFSSEARSSLTSTCTSNRNGPGMLYSDTAGYAIGGQNQTSPATYTSTIDKITFSTDAVASISSTISGIGAGVGGFRAKPHGYTVGGGAGTQISTVYKLDFSNDSIAQQSFTTVQTHTSAACSQNLN